jgi:hypothetical protein
MNHVEFDCSSVEVIRLKPDSLFIRGQWNWRSLGAAAAMEGNGGRDQCVTWIKDQRDWPANVRVEL